MITTVQRINIGVEMLEKTHLDAHKCCLFACVRVHGDVSLRNCTNITT